MAKINYHHLYYFWRVALSGSITKTAEQCHISQSALSQQIKQFETNISMRLFDRVGRQLVLTEMGSKVLTYADEIFTTGEELESYIKKGDVGAERHISIGVLPTLSRNFTESFISPLLVEPNITFTLATRGMTNLLEGLVNHEFDLVLTNRSVNQRDEDAVWQNQLVSRQSVSIIGPPNKKPPQPFPDGYENFNWVLPTQITEIRSAFEAYCATKNFKPKVLAEADDMAMLRLLVRDTGAITALPSLVVKDEIAAGKLSEYQVLPNIYEHFYAITARRKFVPDIVNFILSANQI
ncbi:MAG TPA: LysR family transcriptional regulator [Methylophaga aminisulfidivorans]|uniref:LysR family transcriptional regulator n=1 Tax=Methylophaga aminisulfidivorans TaxID=230105 RepID=A0A7C1VQ19_9GAMM|nr:LysR family transcriptional regulator [Methylophaga aminisulfidivorans]